MIDPKLLEILCCPETKQDVSLAPDSLVADLNARAEAGTLVNRGGQPVREKMDAGLLRADGKVLYPVREDIPVMLVEEAISL
ncbi:MAG TPA: Trm112 family protein [Fibrobacteria bacterium]|jgi:uncharacterized protein YbaR (Trm112 family)|nr:Trm112 family protein [Fibrobacteria bacterium]